MIFDIYNIEATKYKLADCLLVSKEAFQQHLENGIKYEISTFSLEEFEKDMCGSTIFVATDREKKKLIGYTAYILKKDEYGDLYAVIRHTSVLEEYKGLGIGSSMIDYCYKEFVNQGVSYTLCSTSVKASRVINFHLKNGSKIVGLASYPNTQYYSYVFRKQLTYSPQWSSPIFCKYVFIKSAIRTLILRNRDGSKTWIARLLRK